MYALSPLISIGLLRVRSGQNLAMHCTCRHSGGLRHPLKARRRQCQRIKALMTQLMIQVCADSCMLPMRVCHVRVLCAVASCAVFRVGLSLADRASLSALVQEFADFQSATAKLLQASSDEGIVEVDWETAVSTFGSLSCILCSASSGFPWAEATCYPVWLCRRLWQCWCGSC